jgi:hypothetical protein
VLQRFHIVNDCNDNYLAYISKKEVMKIFPTF